MPATPQQLFALLDKLDIAHSTTSHPPLFTVEQGRDWHDKIPGLHCKNLFLKDKKDVIWLVVMPGDKRAHLARLEKAIGAARLSFGKPELLWEVMGIKPGSVTPFALMNDTARRTNVVLDSDMMKAGLVNFHPLHNEASTSLQAEGLLLFIKGLGYTPQITNCGEWAEE
jgi:Ala-tRNA(Pro) deacylase